MDASHYDARDGELSNNGYKRRVSVDLEKMYEVVKVPESIRRKSLTNTKDKEKIQAGYEALKKKIAAEPKQYMAFGAEEEINWSEDEREMAAPVRMISEELQINRDISVHKPWEVKRSTKKKDIRTNYQRTMEDIDRIINNLKKSGVEVPEELETQREEMEKLQLEEMSSSHISDTHDDTTSRSPTLRRGSLYTEAEIEQIYKKKEYNRLPMNDPRKKWGEAKKTRYVRAKEPRNVDTVLSNEQIFDKVDEDEDRGEGSEWWKTYCQKSTSHDLNNPKSSDKGHHKEGKTRKSSFGQTSTR